ncbi:hypothetical protein DBV15_11686, partial [Temnothorax longispinosus]
NYKELSSQDDIENDLPGCDKTPSKIFKSATLKKNCDNNNVSRLTDASAINIAKHLQTNSKTEDVGFTSADQAFAQFIVLTLQKMQDPERNIRQNKIFHVLTAPLEPLIHHCHKNYWNYCT